MIHSWHGTAMPKEPGKGTNLKTLSQIGEFYQIVIKEIGQEIVGWIYVAQGRAQKWGFVSVVVNYQGGYLTS